MVWSVIRSFLTKRRENRLFRSAMYDLFIPAGWRGRYVETLTVLRIVIDSY